MLSTVNWRRNQLGLTDQSGLLHKQLHKQTAQTVVTVVIGFFKCNLTVSLLDTSVLFSKCIKTYQEPMLLCFKSKHQRGYPHSVGGFPLLWNETKHPQRKHPRNARVISAEELGTMSKNNLRVTSRSYVADSLSYLDNLLLSSNSFHLAKYRETPSS